MGGETYRRYTNWLINLGFEITNNINKAHLILFCGGEDVHPKIYRHTNVASHSNITRDIIEENVFNVAQTLNIPCIGICRGAQLLCALSGGQLVQHMFHPVYHNIILKKTNVTLYVNSTHHQMQYPYDMDKKDYEVIAIAEYKSQFYTFGEELDEKNGSNDKVEKIVKIMQNGPPEIVFYANTNSLAIQFHPEDMILHHPAVHFVQMLTKNLVEDKQNITKEI